MQKHFAVLTGVTMLVVAGVVVSQKLDTKLSPAFLGASSSSDDFWPPYIDTILSSSSDSSSSTTSESDSSSDSSSSSSFQSTGCNAQPNSTDGSCPTADYVYIEGQCVMVDGTMCTTVGALPAQGTCQRGVCVETSCTAFGNACRYSSECCDGNRCTNRICGGGSPPPPPPPSPDCPSQSDEKAITIEHPGLLNQNEERVRLNTDNKAVGECTDWGDASPSPCSPSTCVPVPTTPSSPNPSKTFVTLVPTQCTFNKITKIWTCTAKAKCVAEMMCMLNQNGGGRTGGMGAGPTSPNP